MSTQQERERKKVSQLAREYLERGYEVQAELPGFSSPHQVLGWKPDIVVKKGDEIIIVEVKTSETLKSSKEKVQQLAEYAKEHPGIRFDLVITNPRPQVSSRRRPELLDKELQTIEQSLLQNLKSAVELSQRDIALVLAYVLLEGLLTRVAEKKGVVFQNELISITNRADELYDKEIISATVLEFVRKVSEARNLIVHGAPSHIQFDVSDLYSKVASLCEEW